MSYPADLYALVHRGTPGDRAAYARRCRGAPRVLELGCGYGRMLAHLTGALPGTALTGIERDPGLLARARRRLPPSVRLVEGDMRSFDLGLFERILVPYSGLWCLERDQDLDRCLARCAASLAPGGHLLADAYAADGFAGTPWGPQDEAPELLLEVEGERRWAVYETTRWFPERSAFHVTYTYVPDDGGPPVEGVITHRYRTEPELRAHLARAGFGRIETFEGFSEVPFRPPGEHLFVAASLD